MVEGIVIEAVLQVTDNLTIPEPVTDPSPMTESIQAQLDELAGMLGKGEITAGEWNAARGPLQARLAEARRTERRTPSVSEMDWGKPGLLRSSWDRLSISQQRQAIELFIEKVVVAPTGHSNTVDPSRVSVVWKA